MRRSLAGGSDIPSSASCANCSSADATFGGELSSCPWRIPGSVGRPPESVSLRILEGEIFVRSPAGMAGDLADDGRSLAPLDSRDRHVSVRDLAALDGGGWPPLPGPKPPTDTPGGL